MWWLILFLFLAALIAAPIVSERLRTPIGKAARKGAPGKFAALGQGITHYRWIGPVRGPVAVMVHGLTTPSIVWDGIAEGMALLGYRVLVYDLYGRGLSDAPAGAQDRGFFLQQLNDLLDDQGLAEDLTLVGYSMGGAIATSFAAANPHRMKRLILLAPSGLQIVEGDFWAFCRKTPVIGDWLHSVLGGFQMRKALTQAAEGPPKVQAAQVSELSRRGFLPAVLASRRGMLKEVQMQEHQAISRDGIPVVAIWGGHDAVIPVSAMGQLAQWNRAARQEEVKGAGHGLPFTHSDDVCNILRDVLREID